MEDRKVIVIPTKTIPQGVAAMIAYVPDVSDDDNEQAMNEAAQSVRSGSVTYAIRDSVFDGKEIKMEVQKGQKVITGKYTGTEVKLDGEKYIIVRQSDILAIVE